MLNDNCHVELKNLRQIKYFKFRTNSLQKYLMLRVSKILSKHELNAKEMHVEKKKR